MKTSKKIEKWKKEDKDFSRALAEAEADEQKPPKKRIGMPLLAGGLSFILSIVLAAFLIRFGWIPPEYTSVFFLGFPLVMTIGSFIVDYVFMNIH